MVPVPWVCVLLFSWAVASVWPQLQPVLVLWLAAELVWATYFRLRLVPSLAAFKPEDAQAARLDQQQVDGILDNVLFLIRRDPSAFWLRVTGVAGMGLAPRSVPASAARSLLRSLLFLSPADPAGQRLEASRMFTKALARIEEASGGFRRIEEQAMGNSILGWADDAFLMSIIRCTPLVVIAGARAVQGATWLALQAGGWRVVPIPPKAARGSCGLEMWIWRPKAATERLPAIIMIPGAGFGLASFLPLAALLQGLGASLGLGLDACFPNIGPGRRPLVLCRMPWVELGMPFASADPPQWSRLIEAMLAGLAVVAAGEPAGLFQFECVAHSYGTAVANRLLRRLCGCPLFSVGADAASIAVEEVPSKRGKCSLTRDNTAAIENFKKALEQYERMPPRQDECSGLTTDNTAAIENFKRALVQYESATPKRGECGGLTTDNTAAIEGFKKALEQCERAPSRRGECGGLTTENTAAIEAFRRALEQCGAQAAAAGGAARSPSALLEPPPHRVTGCGGVGMTFQMRSLCLLDPIVLGGASTGLVGIINSAGPDLSFAFCANRAGVAQLEIMDYDPRQFGQCMATSTAADPAALGGGIAAYLTRADTLVDAELAHHVLSKWPVCSEGLIWARPELCVDRIENAFHGRWLAELWLGGHLWGAPCATRCLHMLQERLSPGSAFSSKLMKVNVSPRARIKRRSITNESTYM